MRLTKLVPAMGLLAAVAAPSMGVELANGTLSINGEVSVVASYTDVEGDGLTIENGATGGDSDAIDIDVSAEVEFAYRVGEDVDAVIVFASGETGIVLDAAYITWAAHEQFALTAGYYGSWIGYDPGLTITDSLAFNALAGDDVIGFSGSSTVMDDGEQSLDVAAHIFKGSPHHGYLDGTDIGFALSLGYSNSAFGSIGASFTWQPEGGSETAEEGDAGNSEDTILINIYAEITMVEDMIIAGDLYFADIEDATVFGISALVNYTLPTEFPSSITGALGYIDFDGDDWAMEFQLAYLTNPTGNENFGLNFEFKYTTYDVNDDDDFGIFVELLAVIP